MDYWRKCWEWMSSMIVGIYSEDEEKLAYLC